MNLLYEFGRWSAVLMSLPWYWLFFKRKVYYEDKAVQGRRVKGGALIITNHFCPLDYLVNVVLFFPRKLYIVAAEMAFRNKLFRFSMKFWGGIEANRNTKSPRFILEAAREIKKGHLVQIFPEGHNTKDGNIQPFFPGYVAIALRSNAPIIPIITDGNYGLWKRTHILIGKPIDVREYLNGNKYTKQDILRINDIIHQKAQALQEELHRRIRQQ